MRFFGARQVNATTGEYRDGIVMYPATSTAGKRCRKKQGRFPTPRIPRGSQPPQQITNETCVICISSRNING